MPSVLGLFSGVGGFELGLERAGFRISAMCESEPFCRRVLARHWPNVPVYDDVRTLTAARLRADGIAVDVVCGGFPCQPHSVAGARRASDDDRDMWPEVARLLREIGPRWFLGENVPGLLSSEAGRFFGAVLRDLAGLGFDVWWERIGACDVGAPHRRDRIWIVAYAARQADGGGRSDGTDQAEPGNHGAEEFMADPAGSGLPDRHGEPSWRSNAAWGLEPSGLDSEVAHAVRNGQRRFADEDCAPVVGAGRGLAKSLLGDLADGLPARLAGCAAREFWAEEPPIPRIANGVPERVAKLQALGNALVPAIPELLGRAILARVRPA